MPTDKDKKTQPPDLRLWLSTHGHTNLYGDWLAYCIDNNDSTTTLHEWLATNHPEVWREYNSGS